MLGRHIVLSTSLSEVRPVGLHVLPSKQEPTFRNRIISESCCFREHVVIGALGFSAAVFWRMTPRCLVDSYDVPPEPSVIQLIRDRGNRLLRNVGYYSAVDTRASEARSLQHM